MRKLKDSIGRMIAFVNKTYGISDSDYLLVSYPKSGNTYVRFIVANFISQQYHNGAKVDFYTLGDIMPEIGRDNLTKKWPYKNFPRILKTHQLFNSTYKKAYRYIYITRDPRDICISYYHYRSAMKKNGYQGTLSNFIRDERYGLMKINQHIESWSDKSSLIIKYEDLMGSSSQCIYKLFKVIGIDIDGDLLEIIITLSSPENAKKIELDRGIPNASIDFKKEFSFIRNAQVNQWKDVYGKEDLNYFNKNVSGEFIKLGYSF